MNILIVEDESRTAELLRDLIESQPNHLVVNILESIEKTVQYLEKHQANIDLIFMDIELADGQAFQIFDAINVTIPVVFCTAYNEYVLKAFKNNGIDYILKPVEENDVITSLTKFETLRSNFASSSVLSKDALQAVFNKKQKQHSIIVHYQDKMIPLAVENIAVVYLVHDIVWVYSFDHQKYSVFKKLEDIQSALDDTQFFRINRQMIVNRRAVREIEPFFNRKVIVETTIPLPEKAIVSRLKVTPFLNWLETTE